MLRELQQVWVLRVEVEFVLLLEDWLGQLWEKAEGRWELME